MMMDTAVDSDGTAFICPECNFSGTSLPELISHLNEAHSEETASKSAAPSRISSSAAAAGKRSRRKPAFSHQIVSQATRQSPTLYKQQSHLNNESDSNDLWTRIANSDAHGTHVHSPFLSNQTDDSSISMISDENTNININSKAFSNAALVAKRNPNVLHSILSQQRPIAPKNGSPLANKVTPTSSPTPVPFSTSPTGQFSSSSPINDMTFYSSSSNSSMQSFRKNFQCRMCRLTYKNFHDCTAHIRKKHEISHAQAGRFVEKLDTDAPLPPSATGSYKIRVKGKSLLGHPAQVNPLLASTRTSFTSEWSNGHQRATHPNGSSDVEERDDLHLDQKMTHDDEEEGEEIDEGMSAFLIDPVRAFGEVIDPVETSNGHDDEEGESQDEEIILEDDDEDEALWKYQQEINDTSETDAARINPNPSFAQRFKKFQCPHCEHSAPTLTKLKLHVATHINIKPFMCSVCGWRANLRWYIQCHAKKRHTNMSFEVLQLSHEEAEQTINAYMKERGLETKFNGGLDSKRRYQCSLCQFRSNHPKFLEQHLAANHPNKPAAKILIHKSQLNKSHALSAHSNSHEGHAYSKFLIKPPMKSHQLDDPNKPESKALALYNRSSLIQSDGSIVLPDPSNVVYPNFSSHSNFNPNRLFYCALCYRGYRWRYDVKRHHKTMHETPEDEAAIGLSMSPKSIKRRNKEFNRNFRYLEYVPQLDGLIPASMSSTHHSTGLKQERAFEGEQLPGEESDDDDTLDREHGINLSIADARTMDLTEGEAAALLMIEPQRSDSTSISFHEHQSDDAVIVFDEDRPKKAKEKSPSISFEMNKSTIRTSSGFKPYCCPYCFYRTNWRTDSLRHIRARHKIESHQDGQYELSGEEAERTYAEYERTFGFVVSKKVLGRFTDFRHIEWRDLQRSIWEKIKDKQGYEQIILDRLRPDDYIPTSTKPLAITVKPPPAIVASQPAMVKPKRMFACMECAFQTHKLLDLEKHDCSSNAQTPSEPVRGKCLVSLYRCTQCSYRTVHRNDARRHIQLHQLRKKSFYFCSFCGYNHQQRRMITVHIARCHPRENTSTRTVLCHHRPTADFSIQQVHIRRSFLERQLHQQNSGRDRVFYCPDCPQISTSIFEHNHHRSCHPPFVTQTYPCQHCSFASNSSLYTRQHTLLHSKANRLFSSPLDPKNVKHLSALTIFKESLGKHRRYRCPFCKTFSSSNSSTVLDHIQTIHNGNSSQLEDSLVIGSDLAKEILSFESTITDGRGEMDVD